MHKIQDVEGKEARYEALLADAKAILAQESEPILLMSTVSALIKAYFPEHFWVGFYRCNPHKAEELMVGPYQGSMGCLYIPFSKGVCGRAARFLQTQIVDDVLADPEHIACDARSRSEIVVPVFDAHEKLIAVLDIDSEQLAAFDACDADYLEKLLRLVFSSKPLN